MEKEKATHFVQAWCNQYCVFCLAGWLKYLANAVKLFHFAFASVWKHLESGYKVVN